MIENLLLAVFLPLMLYRVAFAQTPELAKCVFKKEGENWTGTCDSLIAQFTISPAKTIKTGIWRTDAKPVSVWSGVMADSEFTDPGIELEIYDGGSGVLRTLDGWFAIDGFVQTNDAIRFQLDLSQEVPPTELDRAIIERAAAILNSNSVWNRADNRKCDSSATQWSIYCAVYQATIDVTGGFHHRRPALELIRQLVEERTAGRNYHHRLMDYNNDPSTSLTDVKRLFNDAIARISRSNKKE